MKAAVVEGPGKLVVRDVPEPTPSEYQARCEILYGATCSGTDSHIVACEFPYLNPIPTILGHESIARVTDVGAKVRNLRPGELVTRVGTPPVGAFSSTWGGFAEVGVATDWRACREDGLPQSEWAGAQVQWVLPDGFDPAGSTMIITWRETLSYATRIGFGEGKRVAVIGSGGNGLAFVAHAANAGAAQVALVGSRDREAAARRAGATDVFDYRSDGLVEAVRAACPDGFDIAIDAVGKVSTPDLALRLLAPGGTLGIYGIDDYGKLRLDPQAARGTFTLYNGGYAEHETHDRVVDLVRAGRLDAGIWLDLDAPYALDDIPAAMRAVAERRCVKALVRMAD